MAEALGPARCAFTAFERSGIGDRGIGLEPCAQRRELRPANGLGDLMEFQPPRDADEQRVGQRRPGAGPLGAVADHFLEPVVAPYHRFLAKFTQ